MDIEHRRIDPGGSMLSDLCSGFEDAVAKLNARDGDFALDLKLLVMRFAKDIAVLIGDASNQFGTVPALLHLAHGVLISLRSEADNPQDRRCRYRREAALLNLMTLCCAVSDFHGLTHFDQRRQTNIDPLKAAVAQA